MSKKLEEYVVTIPDFPEPGIMFRDITSVIQDPDGLKLAVDGLANLVKDTDFDLIVGPESRGFIFGVPVAYLTGKGFIPVRKKGKLPRETVSQKYDLEYGQAEVEIHVDAIKPGQKVVIVDDLIATGGTVEAIIKLVEKLGGQVVRMVFVMELAGLEGRKKLNGYDVESLIVYPGKLWYYFPVSVLRYLETDPPVCRNGRRGRLKIFCGQLRVGSSPTTGMNITDRMVEGAS